MRVTSFTPLLRSTKGFYSPSRGFNLSKLSTRSNQLFSRSPFVRTSSYSFHSQSFNGRTRLIGGLFGTAATLTALGFAMNQVLAEDHSKEDQELIKNAGSYKEGLPEYTRSEVAKHSTADKRIWVIFRNGVYDITDFVEMHPGQEKILLAAGASIDPYWAMYSQHFEPNVLAILEELRIGNLAKADAAVATTVDANDPYASDPIDERSPILIVRSKKPYNAEVPHEFLGDTMITPNELFFIRNHLPVPEIDPTSYVLEITGECLKQPIRFTLEELKTKFKKETVQATIQCAGNRRNEMNKVKEVKGGVWEIGAISNASWSGAKLRDVLLYAGLDPDGSGMNHIQFIGLDKDFEKSYGASIPIDKAMNSNGDVILAYEMNGKDLPRDHGFPVRAVVPGVVGARNVKWLHKIVASTKESPSHWQQKDYKGFSPNVDWDSVDWDSAPAIQEFPVQSAICLPHNGSVIPKSQKDLTIKGFAWAGGGRGIIRVDVSVDGGKTWNTAKLTKPDQKAGKVWSWTLWDVTVPVSKSASEGQLQIVCKAVDSSYNTQPERTEPIWNLRGVLSNAWHRVNVSVSDVKK